MAEAGIFIDESGVQDGATRHYLVTLVIHEQNIDLTPFFLAYEQSLLQRSLPDVPFHSTPLLRGYDDYAGLDVGTRNRLLVSFAAFVRNLPIRYATFSYRSSTFRTRDRLQALIKRDLVNFLVDNLEYFQQFSHIKVYYDDGQDAPKDAVHDAFEFSISQEATVYRRSDYRSFRLAQVADYLCALELTELKYAAHEETPTDIRFFGKASAFRKNYLRHARRKLIG